VTSDPPATVVAAYAASAGLSTEDSERLRDAVLSDPRVRGLEVPIVGHALDPGPRVLARALGSDGVVVVTAIGSTMAALEADRSAGLASTSPDGRRSAVRALVRVRDDVARLHEIAGRRTAIAIEVHSAPRATDDGSSVNAFARSLAEIAAWDWGGADIVVEHCDAARPPAPVSKGFLSVDDELRAIKLAQAPVGMVINWGRSAVEGRSPETPLRHLAIARERGVLSGFVYSGATDDPAGRGGAWADVHLPPSSSNTSADRSLLTRDAIRAVRAELSLATQLRFVGLKASLGREASLEARLLMFRSSVDLTIGA
jgi:hypothetical protein